MSFKEAKSKRKCRLNESTGEFSDAYLAHRVQFFKQKFKQDALHVAASIAGLEECRRLVAEGADVGAKCKDFGARAMHYAALNASHGLELIEYFASRGTKVDVRDRSGEEPIHYAIRAGNLEVADELLKRRQARKIKLNLLHFCIIENNLELARIVLKMRGHLLEEYGENGKHAIHFAALYADLKMSRWLVGEGADFRVFSRDKNRSSALHWAAANEAHGEHLVRYFVSKLAFDVDVRDGSKAAPLLYALETQNTRVARVLCSLGADFKSRLASNETTMNYCLRRKKLKSAKFLYEMDRRLVSGVDEASGMNCLHVAALYADLDACLWLVDEFECAIDARALNRIDGSSVLHYAACNKSHGKEIVVYFFERFGLELDGRDAFGLTPLHYVLKEENIPLAEKMLALGANLRLKLSSKCNYLHYCIGLNKVKSAKFVLGRQPGFIAAPIVEGKYAVHLAAELAGLEMMTFLVEKGCELSQASARGSSVLDIVSERADSLDLKQYVMSVWQTEQILH